MAIDEMVDGQGGVRPHWRGLMGVLAGLGQGVLAERAARLDRLMAEEGITSLIPGAAPDRWRCDPIPLPLPEAEFDVLAAGVAQRARLAEAMLADLYGPQRLVAEGALPPALVFDHPGFLRPCHHPAAPPEMPLLFYAADLLRAPDGGWHVLADHTSLPGGLAHAIENRQRLGRVLPELFASHPLSPIEPFLDLWLDRLRALLPEGIGGAVALLTPGHADPSWYGHVLLARALSCALVEGGDLTVRHGGLFLKTLRGLQPIGVLLRGIAGGGIDPLELAPHGGGVAGLLSIPEPVLRILNHPGAALIEAPGFVPFLPALARRLLGEGLALPSVPTRWLGTAEAVPPEGWWLRSAFEPTPPVNPAMLAPAARAALSARIAAAPWRYAASAALDPSLAPCLGDGALEPRPMLLRMFLLREDTGWRAMPGGLGCVLTDGPETWPGAGRTLAKDVWVLAETASAFGGARLGRTVPLPIRRISGEMPSRVADDFFWLGRYLERLEAAAILLRAAIDRAARPAPTPHELAEQEVLAECLTKAGLLAGETLRGLGPARLAEALPRAAATRGTVHGLLRQVSRMTALLRDRLTGQTYSIAVRTLREVEATLGGIDSRRGSQALDASYRAMTDILAFAATMSGLAAENMVRGGGRLFLDLGRRVERAGAVAEQIAQVLDFPGIAAQPARVEHALRLALELCDSAITYRSRYLAVLQPGPVLDLLLADEGNPRGLAFQLDAARGLLGEIAGGGDPALAEAAGQLLDEARGLAGGVATSPDQALAAVALPPRLRALADAVGALSDQVSRRYFALLPVARIVGPGSVRPLDGAA
jgi:uncharacterized circularly permuted ATP-grasp superfamily protein/uncharacterized alpha-E superfamily protein